MLAEACDSSDCLILGLLVLLAILPPAHRLLFALRASITAGCPCPPPVAIVFGAGLCRDGVTHRRPARPRRDRRVDLYFAGKVEKLLMSGDNRFVDYNEPEAMRQLRHGARRAPMQTSSSITPGGAPMTPATAPGHLRRGAGHPGHAGLPPAARPLSCATRWACKPSACEAAMRIYFLKRSACCIWNVRELACHRSRALVGRSRFYHPLPVLGDPEPIFPG